MEYDAVKIKEQQKSKQTKKQKKITKQINKINQVYPIIGVTEEGFIKSKYGFSEGFFEILDVKKYDLYLLDDEEVDFVNEHN